MMQPRFTYGSGEIFEVLTEGDIARCVVVNRDDISPEVGARCAAEMHDILVGRVLALGAAPVGLVFDVTRGPQVFGPKTRAMLERIFKAGQSGDTWIGVLVSDSPTQRMQFTSLCRECAPDIARVFDRDSDARAWARGSGGAIRRR